MAITFPITLPDLTSFKSVAFYPAGAVPRAQSPFDFSTQVQDLGGACWQFVAQLAIEKRDERAKWLAALISLRSGYGTFLMGDPFATSVRGTGAGTPVVNGAGQSGFTLGSRGWGLSQTVLKAGDWFQLGTGSSARLYMAAADATTDGSGLVTIEIWPELRSSPSDGATIYIDNTVGVFRLLPVPNAGYGMAGNVAMSWAVDEAGIYTVHFAGQEAL